MRDEKYPSTEIPTLTSVVLLAFALAGCEDGKDGTDGFNGADGADGLDGAAGINCWDLNQNGVSNPAEDLNGDGVVDVLDCNALASGAYEVKQLHIGRLVIEVATRVVDARP